MNEHNLCKYLDSDYFGVVVKKKLKQMSHLTDAAKSLKCNTKT